MSMIETAKRFFLPMFEGDHSAFAPYALREVDPSEGDIEAFVVATIEGASDYIAAADVHACPTAQEMRAVIDAYFDDDSFACALHAWCLEQAIAAYGDSPVSVKPAV